MKHVSKLMIQFRSFRTIFDISPRVVSNNDPDSATIATMLRQDTILEVTGPDECNCWLSLSSINQLTMREQLMEEASVRITVRIIA